MPGPAGWRVAELDVVAAGLDGIARGRRQVAGRAGACVLVAVDGHSASGKTTLAARLAAALPRAAVLHGDDLAWHHSFFGWRDLLVEGVLSPLQQGREVSYRPPPWRERERPGAVAVPAGTATLVLEGVGASREDLRDLLDATVWVETPEPVRRRRDEDRMAAGEVTREDYDSWMAAENPFLAADWPWLRADLLVAGAPTVDHDPVAQLVVADPRTHAGD